jgi:hypothetical protein
MNTTSHLYSRLIYKLAKLFSLYIFYRVGGPFLPLCLMGSCSGSFTIGFGLGGAAVAVYLLFLKILYIALQKHLKIPIDWNCEFRRIAALSIIIGFLFFYLFLLWNSR